MVYPRPPRRRHWTFLPGHDPTQRIVCVSYSASLAGKHSRDCRTVMGTAWYRQAFPRTVLGGDKNTELEFTATLGVVEYLARRDAGPKVRSNRERSRLRAIAMAVRACERPGNCGVVA